MVAHLYDEHIQANELSGYRFIKIYKHYVIIEVIAQDKCVICIRYVCPRFLKL